MFRSILVPLDGSELAEHALLPALAIAERSDAELILIQVIPIPSDAFPFEGGVLSVDEQLDLFQRQAMKYLDDVGSRLRQGATDPGRVRLKYDTAVGLAAAAISDYAAAIDADLIVMATHGRSGLSRWTLGSVTSQTLQLSSTPVMIVRPEAAAPVRFDRLPVLDRIMVTLDGSKLAERALPITTQLARLFDSEVLLFRAAVLPLGLFSDPEFAPVRADLWERAEAEAWDYLAIVVPRLQAEGVRVRSVVKPDLVVDSILAAAEEEDVDLIAMTTHGRSGLARVVYGSVTDRVVNSSRRLVLVVRPPMQESS